MASNRQVERAIERSSAPTFVQEDAFSPLRFKSECGCSRVDRFKFYRQGRVMVQCFTCAAQWDAETGVFQGQVPYYSAPIILPGGVVWERIGMPPAAEESLKKAPCVVALTLFPVPGYCHG